MSNVMLHAYDIGYLRIGAGTGDVHHELQLTAGSFAYQAMHYFNRPVR